ncbi:MAG: hypothetical protein PUI89_01645 [Bacteroidales bacterium]|uniref:hypothetical protein n=1 Tax=Porphyromonas sp. TaxID=1924944 RepID=UPI002A80B6B9|nr:hypothetical protein [Porphyromonas sp.]MDD6927985.1 hypothetical protein [Bacteroidales bacterium]MDY4244847.1 hypothetical protein [Porphyromonas sp.]
MKQEKSNRGRKGYPLDFKWRVIDDLLATGESIATTSQRYGITTRTKIDLKVKVVGKTEFFFSIDADYTQVKDFGVPKRGF